MSLGMREEGGGIDDSWQICLTYKVSPLLSAGVPKRSCMILGGWGVQSGAVG